MVAKNPTIGPEGTSEGIVYGYRGKSRTPLISSAGFLGTNHQIADEMGEIIMLRNKMTVEGVQYKLHLAACHKSLLPTWLSLPAPLKYVRTLDIDLQLSTHENFEWVGSVGCLAELSIKVLLRFFRCGPELVEGLEQLPLQEQLRRRMPSLDFATINLVAVPLQGVDMRDLALEGPPVRLTFHYLDRYLRLSVASELFRGRIKVVRIRCCQSVREFRPCTTVPEFNYEAHH